MRGVPGGGERGGSRSRWEGLPHTCRVTSLTTQTPSWGQFLSVRAFGSRSRPTVQPRPSTKHGPQGFWGWCEGVRDTL